VWRGTLAFQVAAPWVLAEAVWHMFAAAMLSSFDHRSTLAIDVLCTKLVGGWLRSFGDIAACGASSHYRP